MGNRLSCNCNKTTNIESENDNTCFAKSNTDIDDIKVKSMGTHHSKNESYHIYDKIIVNDCKQYIDKELVYSKISNEMRDLIYKLKSEIEINESDISHYLNPIRLDDEIFEGQWNINGERHGAGLCVEPNGSVFYGEWFHGLREGKGIYVNNKCEYYFGDWYKGVMNGIGELAVSGMNYMGEFKDGIREGKGVEVTNDSVYYGEFKNNLKEGFGVLKMKDSTFKGHFVNNMMNGQGQIIWEDGRIYEGNWKDNYMHGIGVTKWPNGNKYVGQYQNSKKKGKGIYYWDKMKYYNGEWAHNKPHGVGEYKDDSKYSCTWRYGKPMFLKNDIQN